MHYVLDVDFDGVMQNTITFLDNFFYKAPGAKNPSQAMKELINMLKISQVHAA